MNKRQAIIELLPKLADLGLYVVGPACIVFAIADVVPKMDEELTTYGYVTVGLSWVVHKWLQESRKKKP